MTELETEPEYEHVFSPSRPPSNPKRINEAELIAVIEKAREATEDHAQRHPPLEENLRAERIAQVRTTLHASRGRARKLLWPWARGGDADYDRRVDATLRSKSAEWAAAAAATGPKAGGLVLLGPTGIGKTAAAHAAIGDTLRALWNNAADAPRSVIDFAELIVICTAFELSVARKQHELGDGDAPLIWEAKRAGIVLIDELGAEPASEVVPEVIMHRYSLPIPLPVIVTSFLTVPALLEKYGDGMVRKMLRGSTVAEAK